MSCPQDEHKTRPETGTSHDADQCTAYLAGEDPGLEILAPGCDTNEEIYEPGAQVKTLRDAVVQVDWTYATGPKKGQTQNDVWMYFQDGAVIDVPDNATTDVQIVARYSSNGDIASTINTFGKGRVGVVGVHPEAQPIWCKLYPCPSQICNTAWDCFS